MPQEERTFTLDRERGSVEYEGLPVFIIPRELLVGSTEEFARMFSSLLGKGMIGMYRMVSHRMGEKIFRIHLPPGAEGKTGDDLIELVFAQFVESGWGAYTFASNGNGYHVTVKNFWLGQGLKGLGKKPVCALMEGILASLFNRAFSRAARVDETQCVAIGDAQDRFEVKFH